MFGGPDKRYVSFRAGNSLPSGTLFTSSDLHYIWHDVIATLSCPANSLLSGSRLLENQVRSSWFPTLRDGHC
jgi:hypothetical protein